MAENSSIEKTVEFIPLLKGSDAISRRIRRSRFANYRILLFVLDVIAIIAGFSLAAWIYGLGFFMMGDLKEYLILVILSLIPLSFYPTFQLFDYHRIFFQRNHIINLAKAFCLGMISIIIIILIYEYPLLLEGRVALLGIFVVALIFLIISRFLWNYILNIVRAVGISLIAIGLMALLSP